MIRELHHLKKKKVIHEYGTQESVEGSSGDGIKCTPYVRWASDFGPTWMYAYHSFLGGVGGE